MQAKVIDRRTVFVCGNSACHSAEIGTLPESESLDFAITEIKDSCPLLQKKQ